MERTGLVLEGGGLRGIYTAGVLDAFLDLNITFKYCVGVSAGACNALSYISGQKGRNRDITLTFCNDKRYQSFSNLVTTGNLFGSDMLFNKIPHELLPFNYQAYNDASCKMIAGVTNCKTGEAEYFSLENLREKYDVLRASSSLPFLSKMVLINGNLYLDGGISAPIPIAKSINDGNTKHVAVLTQPKGYFKKPSNLVSFANTRYRKYPSLINAMKVRYKVYNDAISETETLEKEGSVFIIRPHTSLNVSRFEKDKSKLRAAYDMGYNDTILVSDRLINFLK